MKWSSKAVVYSTTLKVKSCATPSDNPAAPGHQRFGQVVAASCHTWCTSSSWEEQGDLLPIVLSFVMPTPLLLPWRRWTSRCLGGVKWPDWRNDDASLLASCLSLDGLLELCWIHSTIAVETEASDAVRWGVECQCSTARSKKWPPQHLQERFPPKLLNNRSHLLVVRMREQEASSF